MLKKIQNKISTLKHPLHETNYVHRTHCLRSKDALYIEIWAILLYFLSLYKTEQPK